MIFFSTFYQVLCRPIKVSYSVGFPFESDGASPKQSEEYSA